jgi:hypothetical protein
MSGYLYFDGTGSDEIDEILTTIERAGGAYHNTADWATPDGDGLSERDRIQIAAGEAAETIARLTAARAHIGRDLVQIRERIAEAEAECRRGLALRPPPAELAGQLAGLRYAELLLATTLARLQPEEGDGG